ncbi:MAG: Zn-ribbon domain-containing OB-fold protein [Candidatus Aenigmatarchaeota archaeon]
MTHRSSVPLFWRLQKAKYNLVGTQCITCKSFYFPPRGVCPKCRSKGFTKKYEFKHSGTVEAFTVIRSAPEGFENIVPYVVAIIKLDEGPNVSGLLVDPPEKIDVGKKVKAVFRRISEDGKDGVIQYGLKWQLADNP